MAKLGKDILLFGGSSEERKVSFATAQNLAQVYNFTHHLFFDAEMNFYSINKEELIAHQNPFINEFKPSRPALGQFSTTNFENLKFGEGARLFLGFHGSGGEDGSFQSVLEQKKWKFTGSSSQASEMCFDKVKAKRRVAAAGVKVAADQLLERRDDRHIIQILKDFMSRFSVAFVKPVANGSSVGLTFIDREVKVQDVASRLSELNMWPYLIEEFISGRELTVGVVGDREACFALPPSEVLLEKGRSFDYEGKYLGRGTQEITPAHLTAAELEAAQALAIQCHVALGCFGYSRTDMIMSGSNFYFLETNTLPGMTRASFIPQQLAAAKIDLNEFIADQLNRAEKRQ